MNTLHSASFDAPQRLKLAIRSYTGKVASFSRQTGATDPLNFWQYFLLSFRAKPMNSNHVIGGDCTLVSLGSVWSTSVTAFILGGGLCDYAICSRGALAGKFGHEVLSTRMRK